MEYATAKAMDRPGQPGGSIYDELQQSDVEAKQLHEVVDQLAERLSPILSPTEPMTEGRLDQVRQPCSDVRTRIADHSATLGSIRDRLHGLLQRIELQPQPARRPIPPDLLRA